MPACRGELRRLPPAASADDRPGHVHAGAAAVIATVILFWGGAVWWQLGPLGQMATRDDIAQLRAELLGALEDDESLLEHVRRERHESTRARQRMVDGIGRLVREADR